MSDISHVTAGDGCRIAYQFDSRGDNPVLILSNSIATDHRMWDRQIAELSKSFRVLRYDTRGHGSSDAPQGPYSLDRLGRDVIELMDALGIARAHFCGLSLGGFVGQWLGFRAPKRIDRLILSNTSPYLGPSPQWDDLIKRVLRERNMAAMADMFIGNWFPPQMIRDESATVDAFRNMILATAPDGLAGCFAVVRDADLRRTNTLIRAPTLVIGGIDDTVTLASHSEAIASAIPESQLVLLPGVHMLNIERQASFLEAVLEFLRED
ncbi:MULTISPECIES: alpha/beta fold hydrolase [unclassified Bradyrhizobium]|uniref:alpha/beta fold hydrolase n=1 Tax=unclassified Bradyrhizobium TaxID=2631580 RepID=UPI0020B24348|nr:MULTISPECIES: alpha/beta fold hydrolase [unclassified Bradyrhizobium]MCP3379349.1 alpha/beta fold hydrolase [Bradyrhizobium sp. CCGUVB4N]MCP3440100.1 alpha/beta fold hydrolase [Bradyrhizobium sp. CCGUVB14]